MWTWEVLILMAGVLVATLIMYGGVCGIGYLIRAIGNWLGR